ncbi:MAG: acetyltransferase [Bacteroidales bacterium]|nr:acetyltransferase [Bacteroidales bacterium]
MRDVAIFGAGGFGRELACYINLQNREQPIWNLVGFFDDNQALQGSQNEFGMILGGKDLLNSWKTPLCVLIAIGSGATVKKIVEGITNKNVEFPNFFYKPSFIDESSVKFGRGNIIIDTHFSCAVSIGDFNMTVGGVGFGHDVEIGSYNSFMPGVKISGNVRVGNECFFGVNSVILQQLIIADNVKLGAGSVMMTKPKSDSLYLGVPAKLFKY